MNSHSQWSEVLSQWVEECALVEGDNFSLEETDINGFFRNFQLIHKNAQQNETEASLLIFLKEHYPNFIPQTGDYDILRPSEYIYVYSMLLHFACVKHPETVFHDICKRLSPRTQRYIASFLEELIDYTALDRQQLCHAIRTVADKLATDDEEQGSSKPFPPPTPKSEMLNKPTKELHGLRAELETECDERDLLEMQNNQYEKKAQSLIQKNEKLQHDVQNLSNESFAKGLEFSSSLRTEDEQIKKQQQFEICEKQKELKELSQVIEHMKEEKSILQEKHKDNTFKSLQENKQELKHIIKSAMESKQELDGIIPENDVTIISKCSQSNKSDNSPENLGRSVVDVLLREKEEELANLKGKIQIIIRMLKTQFPQDSNLAIAVGNLDDTEEEENSPSPSECLTILMKCVNRLSFDFQEETFKVECLSNQVKSKQRHNEDLSEKLLDSEKEVVLLRDQIKQMEKLNFELEQSKKSSHEKVEERHAKHIKEMRVQYEHALKTMEGDLQLAKDQKEKKECELQTTIRDSSELKKEHARYVNVMRVEHENALQKLKTELRLTKALIRKKDWRLLTVTRAKSAVRRNHNEGMNRLELVERSYRKIKTKSMVKLQQLEKRIEELLVENKQVHDKIDTFKRACEAVSENSGEAEAVIKLLSLELLHEVENKTKANQQLIETGNKLEALLKSQSDIINCQIKKLTSLKILVDNQRNTWQKLLTETVKERDSLEEKATTYKLKIQHTQKEKSALLASMEQAVLKMFQKECAELHSKFKASNQLCTELKSVINNRDEQLKKMVAAQKRERDNWLLDMNHLLNAHQAVEKDSYRIELKHLTAFLENHMSLCADAKHNEFALQVPEITNLEIVKVALNSFVSNLAYLQTQANAQVEKQKLELFEAKLRAEEVSDVLKQLLKSKVENLEFTQTHEANTKRIEMLALRLCLTQRRHCRSEQQNHKLLETLNINKSLVEQLRQENISALCEVHRLKQRLILDEVSKEAGLRKLLEGNAELSDKNRKLAASESDLKLKLNKYEQIRQLHDETIRMAESTILRLNHEIGAAKLELSESERLYNQQVATLKKQREDALEELRRGMLANREEKLYLEEHLKNAEDLIAQLNNKLNELEKSNTTSIEKKEMFEALERNARLKIEKMEKARKSNKKEILELNSSLKTMERTNVSLFHEVGAANAQMCEMKELRVTALARAVEFEKKAEECLADADNLRNQNTKLSGQLTKVLSDLQILQKENDFLTTELGNLQVKFVALKDQNEQLEKEHNITIAKFKESEMEKSRLLNENKEKQAVFDTKVEQFKCELCEKLEENLMLRTEQESLRKRTEAQNLEIKNLRQSLLAPEIIVELEERNTTQLRLDYQNFEETNMKIQKAADLVEESEQKIFTEDPSGNEEDENQNVSGDPKRQQDNYLDK